ncbi:MAG: ATP-binding cassette subfamily F protein 3 [Bacillariaceae sp.]|jgi:ATP-binding cassette subfamily F protein 3
MVSARDVCTELLPDLDEDIFEYVVGIIEDVDTDDLDETSEMIAGLLSGAEYCPSDEESAELAKKLLSKFANKNGGDKNNKVKSSSSSSAAADAPLKTLKALKINDTIVEKSSEKISKKKDFEPINNDEDTAITSKKAARLESKRKNRKTSKKKNKPSALDLAEKEQAELEAELVAARVKSVLERTRLGAYRGSLDAKSFTLPNPGGGMPLLEDAACRFVWGRRYGLIGRNGVGECVNLYIIFDRVADDIG